MLYTVTEVAQIFRVSVPTIHNWIKSSSIRAVRVGRSVRIDESEVKRLYPEYQKKEGI